MPTIIYLESMLYFCFENLTEYLEKYAAYDLGKELWDQLYTRDWTVRNYGINCIPGTGSSWFSRSELCVTGPIYFSLATFIKSIQHKP